jgi:hypothetical protein
VAEKLVKVLSHPKRTNGRGDIGHMEQGAIARRIKDIYQEVLKKKNGSEGQNKARKSVMER